MARILVCDDDCAQLDMRKMLLESAGHEVETAMTPEQVLRLMLRRQADVVIMDLRLLNHLCEPDAREGMALIRRIREQDGSMPIIVLSGWPEEIYGQPEEAMVSCILVKPVPTSEMLQFIAELARPACAPSQNPPSA
jgi:CheY-like chemotaxis protein